MFRKFLPKTTCFFEYFEKHSLLIVEAAKEFQKLVNAEVVVKSAATRIHELENQADALTHGCIGELQKTFITPFDRQYIHKLIRRLDDVLDALDEAASRLELYGIESCRPESQTQAEVLIKISAKVAAALPLLRDLKHEEAIMNCCKHIHELEHEGDRALRQALRRLFDEPSDAILVIKWKEIFELLELATDRCEDISDIIQGIVIEAS